MPLLKIQISHPSVSESSSRALQAEGAGIISREIGKSLDFVMVLVETGVSGSFGGKATPVAYIEVKNVGELIPEVTSRLTQRLSALIEGELSIPKDRVYIEFQESERRLWGWNGKTFA
jgi:phenylpyruvate tautomerase